MKPVDILLIIIWIAIAIEIIVFLTTFIVEQGRLLNHRPTYRYPYEEPCFIVKNIEYVDVAISKYTLTVSFFKKENLRSWTSHKFYLYDKHDKYNVGDKLYLNKKQ